MKNLKNINSCIRMCATIGEIPTSYLESMTYEEQLMWLCQFLEKTVIPAINDNNENVKELMEWFDNLDVQDEINNKLEEMVESGQLQEIIDIYVNNISYKVYDNINDLKQANLGNGQHAETLGYYSINDGGKARYYITDEELTPDDASIIELNNGLYGVLITPNKLNVKMFGVYGNGTNDDTVKLQQAIYYGCDNEIKVYLPNGTYLITEELNLATSDEDLRSDKLFDIEGESLNVYIDKPSTSNFTLWTSTEFTKRLQLKNINSHNLGFVQIPESVRQQGFQAWSDFFLNKEYVIENVFSGNLAGENYNLCISAPAPENSGRYADKNYKTYPIYVSSHSGYNAIEIENFGGNLAGETGDVPDNSAIGIVDNVHNSAGVIYIDNRKSRAFERYINKNSNVASEIRPNTVWEINHNGHIAIGCSVDESDPVAEGGQAIKIRDNNPSIALFDKNNNNFLTTISNVKDSTSNEERFTVAMAGTNNFQLYRRNIQNNPKVGFKNITIFNNDPANEVGNGLIFRTANGSDVRFSLDTNNLPRLGSATNYSDRPIVQTTRAGATGSRLTGVTAGFCYFDTTIHKPIWWDGTKWVDANGNQA